MSDTLKKAEDTIRAMLNAQSYGDSTSYFEKKLSSLISNLVEENETALAHLNALYEYIGNDFDGDDIQVIRSEVAEIRLRLTGEYGKREKSLDELTALSQEMGDYE